MYIIGFAETLVQELKAIPFTLTGSDINDVRIWGLIVLVVIFIMAIIGTDWVIKLQLGLMALLTAAILSFIIGSFTLTPDPSEAILGWKSGIISTNSHPDWTRQDNVDYKFFEVFGVFFPAVTG